MPYADVRGRADIMQFFGDKYGETVRVVQIGGQPQRSTATRMELCAGTHTRAPARSVCSGSQPRRAIAAGVRRIEAVAGLTILRPAHGRQASACNALATKLGSPVAELEKKLEALLAQQKELEKALKAAQQREAAAARRNSLPMRKTSMARPRSSQTWAQPTATRCRPSPMR